MALSESELEFLATTRSAAMITVTPEGVAKTSRVGVVVVDGALRSSGTEGRVRTRRLRRDPRCTLFVFDSGFKWLALETTVRIIDGPEVGDLTVEMFRIMQDRPTGPISWFNQELDEGGFRRALVEEGRLVYEFDVHRSYGIT